MNDANPQELGQLHEPRLNTGVSHTQIKPCLYLQGEHPKHKGLSDPQQLGTVERYFLEIMDIPRLQQRIDCFIFTRQFAPNINRVRHAVLHCE